MPNQTIRRKFKLNELSQINKDTYLEYLINFGLRRVEEHVGSVGESILGLGSNKHEAQILAKHPFEKITMSGVRNNAEVYHEATNNDPRVSYRLENAEALTVPSRSYDVVLFKEGLHHLARPLQGVYEMLRVARKAVIFIEPFESVLSSALCKFGLASEYEREIEGNLNLRDNYVYRFSIPRLEALLRSYYLESGWKLDVTTGWISTSVQCHRSPLIQKVGNLAGRVATELPGCEGNLLVAVIFPGSDVPSDPLPLVANNIDTTGPSHVAISLKQSG